MGVCWRGGVCRFWLACCVGNCGEWADFEVKEGEDLPLQIVLLRSDNHPRSQYPQKRNNLRSSKLVMLHEIGGYKRPRST